MYKKYKLVLSFLIGLITVEVLAVIAFLMRAGNIAVLNPKGRIAYEQRDLMITATLLSLLVIVPVFVLVFAIAWRYRASNVSAKYTPNVDHNTTLETIWWGIPILLISVLSIIIWNSSHQLDPFKPLISDKKPITIQVVALQWKWLFIYPDQGIATVNFVKFPEDTPVNFVLTSDAPMNSFWIPQLGGQIYTMSGMSTKLHLMADEPGEYAGSSANISGQGFAGMKFTANVTSIADYEEWVDSASQMIGELNAAEYEILTKPSSDDKPRVYSLVSAGLYDTIIEKYMAPMSKHEGNHKITGHE